MVLKFSVFGSEDLIGLSGCQNFGFFFLRLFSLFFLTVVSFGHNDSFYWLSLLWSPAFS